MTDHISHAERTMGDEWEDMTDAQKDLVGFVVAADGDEVVDEETLNQLVSAFESMTDVQKSVMLFIVAMSPDYIEHGLDDDNYLAHYGVKGMRWGYRTADNAAALAGKSAPDAAKLTRSEAKARTEEARAKVKDGTATVGDAHVAALKSGGRRTTNAMLGDKKFWKEFGGYTAGGLAGLGAIFGAAVLAPAAIPASTLFVATYIVGGTAIAGQNYAALGNIKRAVGVNREISRNAERVAKDFNKPLKDADKKTASLLSGDSLINKKAFKQPKSLAQSDGDVGVDFKQTVADILNKDSDLLHYGVKGQRWGVKRDERALATEDIALNVSQRQQVKIANTISTIAAVGLSTNAAAAAFQLQSRWEHLQVVRTLIDKAENSPFMNEAAKEGLRATKQQIVKGLVTSAAATTAITFAIGAVANRSAKAYFAPLHKTYGDVKPKINSELRALSKDIKKGNRPKMTVKQYNDEVSRIVSKNLLADKNNFLSPFHELARSQLGTEYNTKSLKIKLEKLPNTDLYDKMTVTTPNGLKLVKAIKRVEHADGDDEVGDTSFFFDYEFDGEGFVVGWSSPTIEIANDMFEGTFTVSGVAQKWAEPEESLAHAGGDVVDIEKSADFVERINNILDNDGDIVHYGIKGMRWGRRRTDAELASASASASLEKEVARKLGASEDAIKKAETQGKLKAGGIDALTNKEITELVARVNLEKQYRQLFPPPPVPQTNREKLKEFAIDVIKKESARQIRESLNLITTKKRNDALKARGLMELKNEGKKGKGDDGPKAETPKKGKKKSDPFKVNPDVVKTKTVDIPKRRNNDNLVYNITTLPR